MRVPPAAHLADECSLWPPSHDYESDGGSLYLLGRNADSVNMTAYITVSDAAGRVLFRRLATEEEVMSALEAAQTAEIEAQAAMDRIAQQRTGGEFTEADAA